MKRTISLFLILAMLLSCAILFTGCSKKIDPEYPVTVGGVSVDKEPQKIVVLSDALADVIAYIDYDYKIVGRSLACDQDYLNSIPSVGPASDPSVDVMVSRGADLVIADSTLPAAVRSRIADAGIPFAILDNAKDADGLKTLYTDLGTLLGGAVTGSKKGDRGYKKLTTLFTEYKSGSADVVKTAVYLYLDSDGQLCTFTKDSFEQKIFNSNGAMNIFRNQTGAPVDPVELRMASPTCIFYDDERVIETLRSDERLMNLRALKEGRCLSIPLKNIYRYGVTCEETVYAMEDFLLLTDTASPDEPTDPEPTDDESSVDDSYTDDAYVDDSYDGYDDYYDGDY